MESYWIRSLLRNVSLDLTLIPPSPAPPKPRTAPIGTAPGLGQALFELCTESVLQVASVRASLNFNDGFEQKAKTVKGDGGGGDWGGFVFAVLLQTRNDQTGGRVNFRVL